MFLSACLPAQTVPATFAIPQFSSDISVVNPKVGQGQAMNGKMFSNGDKLRVDMTMLGRSVTTIFDRKTQVTDVLMHAQKMYIETTSQTGTPGLTIPKMDAYDPENPCASQKGYSCKRVGSETVNDRACDKWIFSGSNGDQTVWLDQKLHLPIKTMQADGATFEMKNVHEGAPAAGTFDIPGDYRKFDASTMGGMMGNRH